MLFDRNVYEMAYRIQDASNPYAVIGEIMTLADMAARSGIGMDAFEQDPAVISLVNKLYTMVLPEVLSGEALDALAECRRLAEEA